MKLSVIIPSRNEPYLNKTIEEVQTKSDNSVRLIVCENEGQELLARQVINNAVDKADTEFIMKLDAHCMLAKGFDTELIRASEPNKVQIPRRYRLNAEKWERYGDPIDRELIVFESLLHEHIRGFPWDEPGETMHFQGSCWFMTKDWYKERGFLQTEGYGGFSEEPEEIFFETLQNGGKVEINTNTWYAHWHKPQELAYPNDVSENRRYAFNKWVKSDVFKQLVERCQPIPGWPKDWKPFI